MGSRAAVVLYVMVMAAVTVGVDFMLFRNRCWLSWCSQLSI